MRARRWLTRALTVWTLAGGAATGAQSISGAVLAKNEPHHHLAYEDAALRVLRVSVPAHDTTLLHEHDPDYFWISLGASEVVNAKLGASDAVVKSADLSIHYAVGKFAHVARNPGTVTFNNITVELLGRQTNPRNLCEEAVAGVPLACPKSGSAPQPGITRKPAFATDQLEVALVTIAARATMAGSEAQPAPWLITLDPADARALRAEVTMERNPAGPGERLEWRGGVWRPVPRSGWSVTNAGGRPVRMLEVTPRAP
ncbi:MAG: hypothetical protein U9Q74_01400 [Gemmatimonadota bacterium]|nr:hypothetical protein [Gemmatimonadota bacterium]